MNVYVLEYSVQQGCFHVDTLERSAENNRNMIQQGWAPEFAVIYSANTREECSALCSVLIRNLEQ